MSIPDMSHKRELRDPRGPDRKQTFLQDEVAFLSTALSVPFSPFPALLAGTCLPGSHPAATNITDTVSPHMWLQMVPVQEM